MLVKHYTCMYINLNYHCFSNSYACTYSLLFQFTSFSQRLLPQITDITKDKWRITISKHGGWMSYIRNLIGTIFISKMFVQHHWELNPRLWFNCISYIHPTFAWQRKIMTEIVLFHIGSQICFSLHSFNCSIKRSSQYPWRPCVCNHTEEISIWNVISWLTRKKRIWHFYSTPESVIYMFTIFDVP